MSDLIRAISLEFISVNGNPRFAAAVQAQVERMMTYGESTVVPNRREFDKLSDIIKKHTGMNVIVTPTEGKYYYAEIPYLYQINSASTYKGSWLAKALGHKDSDLDDLVSKVMSSEIDMETGVVTGVLSKLPMNFYVGADVFNTMSGKDNPNPLDASEVAGLMFHEIGHMLLCLSTIGQAVNINFHLTEGVEILQGRKPNKLKIKILNPTDFAKGIDDPELKKVITDTPTDSDYRVAILRQIGTKDRDTLTSPFGVVKRDEQAADLYASRMGYGKEVMTALSKIDREVAVSIRRYTTIWYIILYLFGGFTFAITSLLFAIFFRERYGSSGGYDSTVERARKMRRDSIRILRTGNLSNADREKVENDIAGIDGIIKLHTENNIAITTLVKIVSPRFRYGKARLELEQTLETLVENDLFLKAESIRNRV